MIAFRNIIKGYSKDQHPWKKKLDCHAISMEAQLTCHGVITSELAELGQRGKVFIPMCWSVTDGEVRWARHLSSVRVRAQSLNVWLLATPRTEAHQAPLFMVFSRQEYWRGLPIPSLEDPPNPGIEPMSSAAAGRFFTKDHLGSPLFSPGNTYKRLIVEGDC